MKVLSIIESAYRATLEEQDDTIVWMTQAMRDGGATLTLLLRGNAVNYAVRGQDATGLTVGAWHQTQPPRLAEDLARLLAKGVPVLALAEDLEQRGIHAAELVDGVGRCGLDQLAALCDAHDLVWHW